MFYNSPTDGKIPLCPKSSCKFKCCEFQQSNYIVLYPQELNEAKDSGHNIKHLEILTTDEFGGAHAICTATDTSSCDNGYKPLDCASYPIFPGLDEHSGKIGWFFKGMKCPIQLSEILAHITWVRKTWTQLFRAKPEVKTWLRKVQLVGYQIVRWESVNTPSEKEGPEESSGFQ